MRLSVKRVIGRITLRLLIYLTVTASWSLGIVVALLWWISQVLIGYEREAREKEKMEEHGHTGTTGL